MESRESPCGHAVRAAEDAPPWKAWLAREEAASSLIVGQVSSSRSCPCRRPVGGHLEWPVGPLAKYGSRFAHDAPAAGGLNASRPCRRACDSPGCDAPGGSHAASWARNPGAVASSARLFSGAMAAALPVRAAAARGRRASARAARWCSARWSLRSPAARGSSARSSAPRARAATSGDGWKCPESSLNSRPCSSVGDLQVRGAARALLASRVAQPQRPQHESGRSARRNRRRAPAARALPSCRASSSSSSSSVSASCARRAPASSCAHPE